jgi:hypothetical protein
MIGKHIPSPKGHSSFKGLNDYITGKTNTEEKVSYTDCVNIASVKTASFEMETLAFQNKHCGNPVMHLLLSWGEDENPTRDQVDEAVKITLEEMNLSQCQAVYALHQNTDNVHAHISVNRVDPETKKAINPAHGWTRRGMERAARRIEYAQNWRTENNTWSEIDEQGKVIQKPMKPGINVPQEAQNMENFTGEKSAIRRAQEVLKDRLQGLNSWEELHKLMSENGMEYRKKGSGAVIVAGDIVLKASGVSRTLALGSLEKRFGKYQEERSENTGEGSERVRKAAQDLDVHHPLDRANDNADWRAYIGARNAHCQEAKAVRLNLGKTQKEQTQAMKREQKEERAALRDSLRGRVSREEVNRQRAFLVTKHAYERATLKEAHKAQRKALRQKAPDFPLSYEQWLRERGLDGRADGWRHRKNRNYLQLEPGPGVSSNVPGKQEGLPGFVMTETKQGMRFSSRETPRVAAFIDRGRKITVYRMDDDTLLAALQLGQQKWGGVYLNGSKEYERRCAELAAEHGIRIANPELQGIIIDRQREAASSKEHTVTLRSEKIERGRKDTDESLSSTLSGLTSAELEERCHEALSKLTAEVQKIAQPKITEAAKEFIKIEAKKIKTENAALYKEFCTAKADRDAHIQEEPPKPLFLKRGEWRRKYERWEGQLKEKQHRVEELWTQVGGNMSLKDDDYGKKEVDKRLSDEYALEEAKKSYDKSADWEAIRVRIALAATAEARKRDPKTKTVCDAIENELRKRELEEKRNREIAEMDRNLEQFRYSPGTAGSQMQVDRALRVLKLEKERSGSDEREALRLHPRAAAVLEEAAEYKKRDRGLGR